MILDSGDSYYQQHARYMELIGISEIEFRVLVAVLAYHRCNEGQGVPRREVARVVGTHSFSSSALVRKGWLSLSGPANGPRTLVSATNRAWNNLWPWRMGEPPPERSSEAQTAVT